MTPDFPFSHGLYGTRGCSASLEYPVEVPGGKGRIVGEIHCDHVPVTVTKDSFVFDSAQWRTIVHTVRGQGPLSPLKSQKFGYPPNTSPLAVIYQAYRRNAPGLRYLIPGDGKRALHEGAAEWSRCFHRGLPEYQSDDIWYKAAADHDAKRHGDTPVPIGTQPAPSLPIPAITEHDPRPK